MYSDVAERSGTGPLHTAMEVVDDAVDQLIKTVDAGAVTDLGAFSLVDALRVMERIRNKLPVVDRAMIHHGTEQGIPNVLSERTMVGVLKNGLRVSAGEAVRRVKAAEHLAERHSMLGEPLPPVREHLSQAQRDGAVTPEQVSLIDQTLRKVAHCDPERITTGEELLVEHAGKLGYQDLALFAAKLAEAIDPDGILPCDEKAQQDRRHFRIRQRGDGCWAGEFVLTGTAGQKLANLLQPLTKPQTSTVRPDTPDGTPGRKRVLEDERSIGQRKHDALETLLDALLRGQDVPASGGTPATVLINISWDEFCREFGTGSYADGTPVSARTARDLADQAEIAWCVKTPKGAVLNLYRTRRIATHAQTLALYARDLGCSFPGCDVPPVLREAQPILRTPPRDRLARRRQHQHRQYDLGLQLSPSPLRQTRLDLPDQHRRTPRMDPTQMDRPTTTPDPEPPHHHHQLGSPRTPRPGPRHRCRQTRPARATETTRLITIKTTQDHAAPPQHSSLWRPPARNYRHLSP